MSKTFSQRTSSAQKVLPTRNFGLFARWDGGFLEAAKASLSGWYYIRDPLALKATSDWFDAARSIEFLLSANIASIWVTWSVGFSPRTEALQQEQLRNFIRECRAHGIDVHAYMSMCNMFAADMALHMPESTAWLQQDAKGRPVPYGAAIYSGSPTRYLACLNQSGWRQLLLERCAGAVDAGCVGLEFDNQWTACRCPKCHAKWQDFCRQHGEGTPLPWPEDNAISGWEEEKKAILGALYDKFRMSEYEEIYRMVAEKFPGQMVWGNFNALYNTFCVPCSDAVSTEDGNEPGLVDGRLVHNSGLLAALAGHAMGRRMVCCEHAAGHGRGQLRKKMGEDNVGATRFVPMEPVKHQLSIAECAAHGVRLEITPEGELLRDLYQREPRAMENWAAISRYGRFLRDHPEIYENVRPLASVVSIHSAGFRRLAGDDHAQRPALLGELLRLGVELDYRTGTDALEPGALGGFSVMLLADVEVLSEAALALALEFSKAGGAVVCTGRTGRFDENFRPRGENPLRGATGVIWMEDPARPVPAPTGEAAHANVVNQDPGDSLAHLDPDRTQALARRLLELAPPSVAFEKPEFVLTRTQVSRQGEWFVHLLNYDDSIRPDITVSVAGPSTAYWVTPDSPDGGELESCGPNRWTLCGLKTYGVLAIRPAISL